MNKENFIKALKITVIAILVMVISLVVVLRWKSDLIMERVMASMQDQLVDSLRYTEAGMEKVWAQQAGLGWIGKHSNLVSTDFGSGVEH